MEKPKKLRIYVSGPITIDKENYEKNFEKAAKYINDNPNASKYEAVNPLDYEVKYEDEEERWSEQTWLKFIIGDLDLLKTCDAIALMPGWDYSCGCIIEFIAALKLGLKVYSLYDIFKNPDSKYAERFGEFRPTLLADMLYATGGHKSPLVAEQDFDDKVDEYIKSYKEWQEVNDRVSKEEVDVDLEDEVLVEKKEDDDGYEGTDESESEIENPKPDEELKYVIRHWNKNGKYWTYHTGNSWTIDFSRAKRYKHYRDAKKLKDKLKWNFIEGNQNAYVVNIYDPDELLSSPDTKGEGSFLVAYFDKNGDKAFVANSDTNDKELRFSSNLSNAIHFTKVGAIQTVEKILDEGIKDGDTVIDPVILRYVE